jgi:segregation and condensation protein B
METLAVVAYRQPVLRADVEAIRGVQCGEILRQLMERDLVRIVGRSEELGRPFLYGTTRRFLGVFGLRHLDELPRAELAHSANPPCQGEGIPEEPGSEVLDPNQPELTPIRREESKVKTACDTPSVARADAQESAAVLMDEELVVLSQEDDEDFDDEDFDEEEDEEDYDDEEDDEDYDEDEDDEDDEWEEVDDEDDWDEEDEEDDWDEDDWDEDEDEDEDWD